jgi:hypothetical protein
VIVISSSAIEASILSPSEPVRGKVPRTTADQKSE